MKTIKINEFEIKNFGIPFVIAEIGANHNGDLLLAKRLILHAYNSGANAVKFQSWDEESIVSDFEYNRNTSYSDSKKKHFGSLREMVREYQLNEADHIELKKYCDQVGILFSSTPFTFREVDLLEKLDVKFYKIASMDINNERLLEYIAKKDKPIFLSTGMSTIGEIENAVKLIESFGNSRIVILHCVSLYPPKDEQVNLRNITMLQNMFPDYPIGFSDHTLDPSIAIASIALGASVIEKHFTLDKNLPGWDHEISADPSELEFLISSSIKVSKSLGNYGRNVSVDEEKKKIAFRRSIVVNKSMSKGSVIEITDLDYKRPGGFIDPNESKYVVGRIVNKEIKQGELLKWDDLL